MQPRPRYNIKHNKSNKFQSTNCCAGIYQAEDKLPKDYEGKPRLILLINSVHQ